MGMILSLQERARGSTYVGTRELNMMRPLTAHPPFEDEPALPLLVEGRNSLGTVLVNSKADVVK